jgi:hypothetical protein
MIKRLETKANKINQFQLIKIDGVGGAITAETDVEPDYGPATLLPHSHPRIFSAIFTRMSNALCPPATLSVKNLFHTGGGLKVLVPSERSTRVFIQSL